MAATAVTHSSHAMTRSSARFNTRSTTNTFHRARVALAMATGALAMDALTMNVLTMGVLSVRGCPVRPARGTHDLAEVEPIVVRNLTPAFPGFMRCYNVVEALARCISQQVCFLQFTPTEPR